MTACIQLGLRWPLLLCIARCIVPKPYADTLENQLYLCSTTMYGVITFSRSSGIASLFACAMSDMSLDTRVMSFDRVFSLLRSLVSRYSSQASTKVCLKDGRTQRAYGAMLMGIKKVGKN